MCQVGICISNLQIIRLDDTTEICEPSTDGTVQSFLTVKATRECFLPRHPIKFVHTTSQQKLQTQSLHWAGHAAAVTVLGSTRPWPLLSLENIIAHYSDRADQG